MNGQVKIFHLLSQNSPFFFLTSSRGQGVRERLGKVPFNPAGKGLTEQIPCLQSDRLPGVLGPRIERWFRALVAIAVIGMQINALRIFGIREGGC